MIKAKLSEIHTSLMEYISILKIDDLENNIDLPGGELTLILGLLGHEG